MSNIFFHNPLSMLRQLIGETKTNPHLDNPIEVGNIILIIFKIKFSKAKIRTF